MAPVLRPLSPRVTSGDLWASLDALAVEKDGLDRLEKKHSVSMDATARRRFSAYVQQAKQYYARIRDLDPVAKPLLAYYFALNLSKAYLTAVDPGTTSPDRIPHGLNQAFTRKSKYYFQHEAFRISATGVFRLLAERTGQGHCYAAGYEIRLVDILPYLADGYDLYADALGQTPKLVPIQEVSVLFAGRSGWLRVEIERDVLQRRKMGPEKLLTQARAFGNQFRLVKTGLPSYSFDSIEEYPYAKKRAEVVDEICAAYDMSLIATRRQDPGGRRFIVLSDRSALLSHEAVAFAVLHHLSNMVRYRPQDVDRLRGTKYFWLFASWVDRTCEGFLLSLISRISREEHLIV